MLSKLRFLSFEVGRECDLAAAHPYCPVNRPERYANSAGKSPLGDNSIVAFTCHARSQGFNFKGLVAFHYYNEPLLSRERIDKLLDHFAHALPQQQFALWTNGNALRAEDKEWLGRFAAVYVTAHNQDRRQFFEALKLALPDAVKIMPGGHDDRGSVYDVLPKLCPAPCWRPTVTEMIVDYLGELHLCCVDWKAAEKIGNLQTDNFETCLRNFAEAARLAREGAPEVCRRCRNLRRSPFVAVENYNL
jgi:hypothetical protein